VVDLYDLPPGWHQAESVRLSQGKCAESAYGNDRPVRLAAGSNRRAGLLHLFVQGIVARCDQPLAAFVRRQERLVQVLIEPAEMRPAGVARCSCRYDLDISVPDRMLTGAVAAVVFDRGDRYAIGFSEPRMGLVGTLDLRGKAGAAAAGAIYQDPAVPGWAPAGQASGESGASASPSASQMLPPDACTTDLGRLHGRVEVHDLPHGWSAALRHTVGSDASHCVTSFYLLREREDGPLVATAPASTYRLVVGPSDSPWVVPEGATSAIVQVGEGRTITAAFKDGTLAVHHAIYVPWRVAAAAGIAGALAGFATWIVMRPKGESVRVDDGEKSNE